MKKIFGINKENRLNSSGTTDIPVGLRRSGFSGGQGIYANYFNQLLYEAQGIDHVVGTASQLALNDCTCKIDQSTGRFLDKNGVKVDFHDYDRIWFKDTDLINSNIDFINSDDITYAKHLQVKHLNGGKINLGFSSGTIPFKIKYAPVVAAGEFDHSFFDIMTNIKFEDMSSSLSFHDKRIFAYQGIGGRSILNGDICYHGKNAGETVFHETTPDNPYLTRMDGHGEHWSADASNATLAWARMLNRKMNGWRDGSEVQGRFTNPGTSAWLFQLNTAHRFLADNSDSDLEIHSRPSSTTGISATASFDGSNVVTFTSGIGDIKNGMRIFDDLGTLFPSVSTNTTIVRNISGDTAEMYDWATGSDVTIPSNTGVSVKVDNSGAVGGSEQDFQIQGHSFRFFVSSSGTSTTAPYLVSSSISPHNVFTGGNITSDEINGTPKIGKQTHGSNTSGNFYYKL